MLEPRRMWKRIRKLAAQGPAYSHANTICLTIQGISSSLAPELTALKTDRSPESCHV